MEIACIRRSRRRKYLDGEASLGAEGKIGDR